MAFQNYRVQTQASDQWTARLLIGGSDPLQTTGAVQINLASGATITVTNAGSPNWVSTPTVSGAVSFWNGVSGLSSFNLSNVAITGSINTVSNVVSTAGSPFGTGDVIQLTARVIISGGMWVSTSGNNLAIAAAASTAFPLGIALATAGSNTTVNVLVRGIYQGQLADVAILAGNGCVDGAGNSLATAGSTAVANGIRAIHMVDAGSAAVTTIYLL